VRNLELILIRHGQSEANIGQSSDPDCPLTPLGVEQSRAAGARLRNLGMDRSFTGVVSPYRRAQQTAAEIASATGLSFEVDDRIREWGPPAIIAEKVFREETDDDLRHRILHFLTHRAGKLVVVSHGSPIGLITQLAVGVRPPKIDPSLWLDVENCCLRWLIVPADLAYS